MRLLEQRSTRAHFRLRARCRHRDTLEPLLLRRSDRCAQLALLAAREAWAMATTAIAGIDPAQSPWCWALELAGYTRCMNSTTS